MSKEIPTPGQVATNEAAKQAVMLVFAVVTVLIFIPIQRRMLDQMTAKVQERVDSSAAAAERMKQAQQAERRWDRLGNYLFDVRLFEGARRAWARARKARAEYEDARSV